MEPIPDDHPRVLEVTELLSALPQAIEDDFVKTLTIYQASPDDSFARRLLVRGVMGYIEGQMAVFRQQLLLLCELFMEHSRLRIKDPGITRAAQLIDVDFTAKDYLALLGKTVKGFKNGDSSSRDAWLCLEENMKLLFRLHGRAFGHSLSPLCDADGWKLLQTVKQKRNALTHPKCAADLDVTPEQARQAIVLHIWMHDCLNKMRALQEDRLEAVYQELKD